MRYILAVGLLILISVAASASNELVPLDNNSRVSNKISTVSPNVIIAQECGFFAILGCFKDQSAAEDWNNKIQKGHVIDTSSARYPSFQPGYYCVVHGPTIEDDARDVMRIWKAVVPDAYVKSSC
jgi:hypothetical protein